MENIVNTKNVMDHITKQIFNINWENKKVSYETNNFNYDKSSVYNEPGVSMVIDNGSFECRAGWSICDEPNLRFRSIVARPKIQGKNSNDFLVGNEILSFEQGKLHKKSPFEKNFVTHLGTQEHLLDHIFSTFNQEKIEHPITFTEPLLNLNWSRKNITEMMFEIYSVPSLCYGVDMLFSLDKNKRKLDTQNCLIISSSYQTTHIVPIINGRVNVDKTRRIGIGSFQGLELLSKSLHLKYPDLKSKLTNDLLTDIQENYTMCALDYKNQIKLLEMVFENDQEKLKDEEKKRMFGSLQMYEKAYYEENSRKQYLENRYSYIKPYKNQVEYNNYKYTYDNNLNPLGDDLITELVFFEWPKQASEVVLTDEDLKRKQEMRKEQSRRLREIMQKKREENVRTLEKELIELEEVMQIKQYDKYQFEEAVMSKGFASEEEIQKRINKIDLKINFNKESKETNDVIDEDKRWPLINIPDEDLTEEQIRSKRFQKMQRSAYLTRLEKREVLQKEKERIEEIKQKDPENYLLSLYIRKKELLDRIENYKLIRKELSNRHSKTNLKRMMVLAELGKEDSTTKKKNENSKDDSFGMRDDDWDVYRGISRHNLSEDEEEDKQQLEEVEGQIIEMDPNYFKYTDSLTQGFMYGTENFFLGVDQFRGAELLFQPCLIGVEQAGIIELILSVFKTLTFEEQKSLAKNIFLTGGNTKIKYLENRIYNELRTNLNCDIDVNVFKADNPELDAWKGAAAFANDINNKSFYVTKQEYEECGSEYFKDHRFSNMPVSKGGEAYKKQKLF
jgi:actin-related protein 5